MRTQRSIYPLHLAPFESYMYVDDSPRYPMTFVVDFEFSGELQEGHFQNAIDEAILRHPMLRSTIRKAKANRDCWVAATNYNSQVEWLGLDDTIRVDGTGEFLNLREEIGFRCWVRKDSRKAIVTFIFHHSACDGIGAYQFIGDVLWFYATSCGEALPPLVKLNERDLKKRMKSMLDFQFVREAETSEPVEHPVATPVAPCDPASVKIKTQLAFPGYALKTYDRKEFRELRLKAQQDGQTTNSRLLQSLLIALQSWNAKFDSGFSPSDLFAINMPMDLRKPDNPPFSAINLVTSAFVRRTAEQIARQSELETTLAEEVLALKHNRFRSEFMKMLLQWPLDMEASREKYDPNACQASVVFSNTGDPTKRFLAELPREKGLVRAGNLILEDINGTPPLRSETRASISIFTYRRQLRICLRMDQCYFSQQDADRFVEHFAKCFEDGSAEPG